MCTIAHAPDEGSVANGIAGNEEWRSLRPAWALVWSIHDVVSNDLSEAAYVGRRQRDPRF